jgi:hypothetical protein
LNNALNWVWLAVALCALVWLAYRELRRRGSRSRWSCPHKLLAVLLASFALFPAISNSDDLLSYSLLNEHLGRHGGYGSPVPEDPAESSARVQLARVLEALEHCQTALVCALSVVLFCIAYTLAFRPQTLAYSVVCRSGRSPPSI